MKKFILIISIPFLFAVFLAAFFYFYDFRSEEITVAVLDTGVEKDHELLQGKVVKGLDLLDYHFNPTDPSGHGTHIAGIIISNNPDAKILPIKILKGEKEELWELKDTIGVLYAIYRGAHVINMSYTTQENIWLDFAIKLGVKKGVTFVSSAGNEGKEKISYPASHPDVISVGNTYTERDELFKDSNYHDDIDFVAPGFQIKSSNINGTYSEKTGTSMSSAYVSGVIAYMLENERELTPSEIKQLLTKKSRPVKHVHEDGSYTLHNRIEMERIKAYYNETPYINLVPFNASNNSYRELLIETENVDRISVFKENRELLQFHSRSEPIIIGFNKEQIGSGKALITIHAKFESGDLKRTIELNF